MTTCPLLWRPSELEQRFNSMGCPVSYQFLHHFTKFAQCGTPLITSTGFLPLDALSFACLPHLARREAWQSRTGTSKSLRLYQI